MKNLSPDISRTIVDALGGTTAVARLCGIRQPSVSNWKKRGIPFPWVSHLRLLQPGMDWPSLLGQPPEPDRHIAQTRSETPGVGDFFAHGGG